MPRLEVRLFAVLRERAGRDSIVLDDVPEGATIEDLKALVMARNIGRGEHLILSAAARNVRTCTWSSSART